MFISFHVELPAEGVYIQDDVAVEEDFAPVPIHQVDGAI